MRNPFKVISPLSTRASESMRSNLKPFEKNVAEIEADAARQLLQAHQRQQLADVGVDLEELAVGRLQLEVAGERREVDVRGIAAPRERTEQRRLPALDAVGKPGEREERAGVGRVELELELAGRRSSGPARHTPEARSEASSLVSASFSIFQSPACGLAASISWPKRLPWK